MSITAKQERFAQEWFATGNKSEAYRRAYPKSKKWSEQALNGAASTLSRHSKVLGRFEELAKASQKRNETNVDLLDRMLKKAYKVADDCVKPSAMVAATLGLAKLHGLDVETQHRVNAEKSGGNTAAEAMLELARRLPD